MMHTFFWWNSHIENFLFSGYNVVTNLGLFATCLMLGSMAIFFEFIKVLQARLRQKEMRRRQEILRHICRNENVKLVHQNNDAEGTKPINKYRLFVHELTLWLSQEIVGYGLMLAVMVYNGYLMVAVAIGSGIGYFVFGPTILQINIENCAVKKESLCYTSCLETAENANLISNSSDGASSCPRSYHTEEEVPPCHSSRTIIVNQI